MFIVKNIGIKILKQKKRIKLKIFGKKSEKTRK